MTRHGLLFWRKEAKNFLSCSFKQGVRPLEEAAGVPRAHDHQPNRHYIPELDQLRGLAALLVFFYHGFQLIGAMLAHGRPFNLETDWIITRNPLIAAIEEGHAGVGLFIVVSGFVLSLGAIGHNLDYGRFLKARLLRIYPLIIVFATTAIATKPSVSLAALAESLPPFNLSGGLSNNLTSMFWAVAVEFQCYLVFPFLLLFSNPLGTRFLLQVIAVAFMLRLLAVLGDGANPREIAYWTVLGRMDQFCLGMIAARLWVLHGWRERIAGVSVLPGGFVLLLALWAFNNAGGWVVVRDWKLAWPTLEGAVWAAFLVSYLRAATALPGWVAAPLTRFGEVSYSFYLVHYTIISICIRKGFFVRATGVGYYDSLITAALVVLPITFGCAVLLFETVEKPFLRLRPRYITKGLQFEVGQRRKPGTPR